MPKYMTMAPTQVREPFHRDGWVFEEKVDGWRILAYKEGARVRLVSRNGRDHTRRFAGIATAVAKLSALSLVLDGEVAIYDQKLRSRFEWLREPDPEAAATPPLFVVFDLLHHQGREVTVLTRAPALQLLQPCGSRSSTWSSAIRRIPL
jgi:bifunctional non-homologous end joining protein LigD